MTPEEKQQVEKEAETMPEKLGWSNDGTAEGNDIKRSFKAGAEYGYSLALERGRQSQSAQQLYDKYQAGLKELQSHCTHPTHQQSDWMEQQWAPGHGTGLEIRICTHCHAKIDERGMGYINASVTFAP